MNRLNVQLAVYQFKTAFDAFLEIYKLPQEKINAFLKSYELFNKENIDTEDEKNIINYYSVLNHLCALGEVEKMYIPPVMDVSKSVSENQRLFEHKMCDDLNIKPGDNVLDIGCGRGRVAAHIAADRKAKVTGINIDEEQLRSARKFIALNHLEESCDFVHGSFNDPLPFAEATFDALYQIQVITYAKNKEAVFAEMFRVLKPGAKLSFLDWVILDNYDAKQEHHRHLLNLVKPLIGAVNTPSPHEIKTALENVGFHVLSNKDASIGGHQFELIEKADRYYNRIKKIMNVLVCAKILPEHFRTLMDRLTRDGEAFIEGDRLGLFTTSYQTIAQKPPMADSP